MKIVSEATMFKLLAAGDGVLFCITTKRRAFFLFLSRFFLGGKVAPTTDPDIGIVELSGYSIPRILRNWESLWRVKAPALALGFIGMAGLALLRSPGDCAQVYADQQQSCTDEKR